MTEYQCWAVASILNKYEVPAGSGLSVAAYRYGADEAWAVGIFRNGVLREGIDATTPHQAYKHCKGRARLRLKKMAFVRKTGLSVFESAELLSVVREEALYKSGAYGGGGR